ncbi:MAG: fibronectin type III domain-containing protein [Candidatus Eremiobacteraeota bacterium]|nr:fibronectin type III domain-containing protein [Candidatus Eremiobacteraeota bacterium]MCW5867497.1 fibronectin type III domain-containing protein [Candidatus Eremiobacteraeota bacterium]
MRSFTILVFGLVLTGAVWAQAPGHLNISQPPGNLAQSQLDLRWDPVPGALGYEVLRKVNGKWWLNEEDPNCTPMTNSTSITGLTAGADFEFCVRAVLASGVSANGPVAKAHTLEAGAVAAAKPQAALNLPDVPDPEESSSGTRGNTDPDPVPEGASISELLGPAPPKASRPPAPRLRNDNAEPDPVPANASITDLVPPPPKSKPVSKEEPKGPPPPAPEGLMGLYNSQSDIRLSWRPVREATGYQVEEEKDGKWVLLEDGIIEENRPSFVLKNRGAGPYLFRVRAVRYGVRSNFSLPTKIER